MTVTVRQAGDKDRPGIGALLAEARLPSEDLQRMDMADFLVARSATGRRLGAVGLERFRTIGLLRSLVVAEGARGNGTGRRLVERLEAEAAASGVRELWLLTEDAEHFFERLGYAPAERGDAPTSIRTTAEFSSLCPADAHLMHKRMGPRGG
jgi:amino-acid N-acetyltransferase